MMAVWLRYLSLDSLFEVLYGPSGHQTVLSCPAQEGPPRYHPRPSAYKVVSEKLGDVSVAESFSQHVFRYGDAGTRARGAPVFLMGGP